ncbi:hypothetical protein [Jiangella alba]|uniref:PLD phosphodiesterase domain-containing protein n=1 Tax=Jiangella alba TaxID=561176 RepID=A0A1H5JFK0_9ACTN|nr:hypothetical protein [Jiangella alba]SEE50448.1 hypothetical protein SAMN04488561_1537 [Jiangella alba]
MAGIAGLAAIGLDAPGAAAAPSPSTLRRGLTVTDLGPAATALYHTRGVVAADGVLYVGSRNLEPTRVFGVDLATKTAVSEIHLGYMNAIGDIAVDPTGRYVYAGGDHQGGVTTGNLYRIDVTDPEKRAEDISLTQENIQGISVAPDGVVYFAGRWTPRTAYQWDPVTRQTTKIGSMPANIARLEAVASSGTTIFCGGVVNLEGNRAQARLFAIDRVTGQTTDITPPEVLEVGSGVRDLNVIDGKLFVGVTAFAAPSPLVLIDAANPSSYEMLSFPGIETREFCRVGDSVYFRGGSYDLVTGRLAGFPVRSGGGSLSYSAWGDKLVGVGRTGQAYIIDLAARTVDEFRFVDTGVRPSPQLVMGIAAGGGYAYACSGGMLTRHDLSTGEVVNFDTPGETKSAIFYDGIVWLAQYGGGGLWGYDSRTDEPPWLVAALPVLQNRSLRIAVDTQNDLILIGVQSDQLGGGSLCVYHRDTELIDVFENPISMAERTRAVICHEGIAYLGGENTQSDSPQATVVAFDPVAGVELWRMETGQPNGIGELAVRGRHLYGISRGGGFFVIDIPSRAIVHRADVSGISPGEATLITNRDAVYGVSDTSLFRFDPATFAPTVMVDELDGGWYGWPRVGLDERGRFYTLRDRNLIQVDLGPASRRPRR